MHFLNYSTKKILYLNFSSDFFNDVYHRFLLATRCDYKCMCLKAMGVVYERHRITIGSFSDSKEIIDMMSKCINIAERDHYVSFTNIY